MRYVPEDLLSALCPPPVPTADTAAEHADTANALVSAYGDTRRLGLALVLWLGTAVGVVVPIIALADVTDRVGRGQPLPATLASAAVGACGLALLAMSLPRGLDMLRAGRELSVAAGSWVRTVPDAPAHPARRALQAALSSFHPAVLLRNLVSALTGLGAVICASVAVRGLFLAASGSTSLAEVSLAVIAMAMAVLLAVPAVTTWRGTWRIQRALTERGPGAR